MLAKSRLETAAVKLWEVWQHFLWASRLSARAAPDCWRPMMQALRSIAEEQGRLTLSQFKRVKQLGSGDVGLVDLVELNARQVRWG